MKKTGLILSSLALCAAAVIGYAGNVVTIKGSDTIVILAQRWAEKYMGAHAGTTIQVTGGGSGVGISALINGTTDICSSSRPMKTSERDKLKQRFNSLGVETKVAKDGLSVYVNATNGVKELTLDQMKKIFTNEITNWNQVGGKDAKIVVYGRENSSGTYVYFRDFVLGGKDYSPLMQTLPGTAAVVNAVAKDPLAIGFGGAAYAKGINQILVKKDAASQAFAPTAENVKNNVYPITRYLYFYTRSAPTGSIKAFIDWVLSAEGQAIITEVGYFPVK